MFSSVVRAHWRWKIKTTEIGHFSEAKGQRSVTALMEFVPYLEINLDVRYQSVRRKSREKESQVCKRGIRAEVFEVL